MSALEGRGTQFFRLFRFVTLLADIKGPQLVLAHLGVPTTQFAEGRILDTVAGIVLAGVI